MHTKRCEHIERPARAERAGAGNRHLWFGSYPVRANLISCVLVIFLCCKGKPQTNEAAEPPAEPEYAMPLFSQENKEPQTFPPPPPMDPAMMPPGIQFKSGDFPSVTSQATSTYEFNE